MSLSVKNRNVTASIDGRVRRSYGLGVPAIGDNGGDELAAVHLAGRVRCNDLRR